MMSNPVPSSSAKETPYRYVNQFCAHVQVSRNKVNLGVHYRMLYRDRRATRTSRRTARLTLLVKRSTMKFISSRLVMPITSISRSFNSLFKLAHGALQKKRRGGPESVICASLMLMDMADCLQRVFQSPNAAEASFREM